MAIDIRLPNITGKTTPEQVSQLQSYMYQMVQQLNWALNTISSAEVGDTSKVLLPSQAETLSEKEALSTFESIKDLIIKSADIVSAYEEQWDKEFNGKYFAESDFGTYLLETAHAIEVDSTATTDYYANKQEVSSQLTNIDTEIKDTSAYIKKGLLDYEQGNAVYGVEIGQTSTTDGTFKKYARFTAGKLSFYDGNGNEVAYISNQRSYITDAIFLGMVQFGDYKIDTSDGLAFAWIGG